MDEDGHGYFSYRGHECHYERRGDPNARTRLLFLPGFGVGSFHFRAQLDALTEDDTCVYALDFCGQGRSWPPGDAAEVEGFAHQYSLDAWVEQVEHFLENVIPEGSVYVAGNSLGGLTAINLAAKSPSLVRGLILLNATPFWGFVPALSSPPTSSMEKFIHSVLPWDGTLPAPSWFMRLVTPYWDRFRDFGTIRNLLKLVYVSDEKLDDELVRNIRRPTDNPFASSTFASVLWSPKPRRSLDDALNIVREEGTPVALVFGREDPWVTPLWGQRMKRLLPGSTYYEISPSGHCPHHETPEVVNELIRGWVNALEEGQPPPKEPVMGGKGVVGSLVDGNPRRPTEWLVYCLDALKGDGGLRR